MKLIYPKEFKFKETVIDNNCLIGMLLKKSHKNWIEILNKKCLVYTVYEYTNDFYLGDGLGNRTERDITKVKRYIKYMEKAEYSKNV